MIADPFLRIEIKNVQPVELIDLTNSFWGFADEYKRYLSREGGNLIAPPPDSKLYVKEIRAGSILADLMSVAPAVALAFAEHAETIIKFSSYLKLAYDFLLGKADKKPDIKKINYENLSTFVEPVAKDNAAQLNCHTVINGNANIILNINSNDANAIQNRAKKEIDLLQEPIAGLKEKMLLYWYQARNDPKSQIGDKAIIENIHEGPVKTIFRNDNVKTRMLYDHENPFTSAYIVDVEVETIKDKPALYKVINVHERFPKPPEDN